VAWLKSHIPSEVEQPPLSLASNPRPQLPWWKPFSLLQPHGAAGTPVWSSQGPRDWDTHRCREARLSLSAFRRKLPFVWFRFLSLPPCCGFVTKVLGCFQWGFYTVSSGRKTFVCVDTGIFYIVSKKVFSP
jgi:hypothetical protein